MSPGRAAWGLLPLLLLGLSGCLRLEEPLCESDDACLEGELCSAAGFCIPSDPRCEPQAGTCGETCMACGDRCQFVGDPARIVESRCLEGQVQLGCATGHLELGGACRPLPTSLEIAADAVGGSESFWSLVAGDGSLWIASLDQGVVSTWSGATGVTVRRRPPGTQAWNTEFTLVRPSTKLVQPVLAEDGQGKVHLLVTQMLNPASPNTSDWDLLHAFQEGATWSEATVPGPANSGGSWPAIVNLEAITVQERVFTVVAYRGGSGARFLAARYTGSRWILDERMPDLAFTEPLRLRAGPDSGQPQLFLAAGPSTAGLFRLHIWGYTGDGWSDLASNLPQPVDSLADIAGVAAGAALNVACVVEHGGDVKKRKLAIWPGPTPTKHDLGLADGRDFFPPTACEPFPSAGGVLVVSVGDVGSSPPLRLESIGPGGVPHLSTTITEQVPERVGRNALRAFESEGTIHIFTLDAGRDRSGSLRHLQIAP